MLVRIRENLFVCVLKIGLALTLVKGRCQLDRHSVAKILLGYAITEILCKVSGKRNIIGSCRFLKGIYRFVYLSLVIIRYLKAVISCGLQTSISSAASAACERKESSQVLPW